MTPRKQQPAPTLRELERLAKDVWGEKASAWEWCDSDAQLWDEFVWLEADMGGTMAAVRHPSRATARRALHAALTATKGGK